MEPPRFTRPLIDCYSTLDLTRLLTERSSSSRRLSLASLLTPFAHSRSVSPTLNNVQVRTPPNHEPRNLSHFSVEFKDKVLPNPTTASTSSSSTSMQRVGSTSDHHMISQGAKDELWLDQLSEQIINSTNSNPSSLPKEIQLKNKNPTVKLQYDLQGNPLPSPPSTPEESEEWESKTLDDLTPWYREFRDQVFSKRSDQCLEFETWSWPVGCILGLTSQHPDPLNAISLLWDLTSSHSSANAEFVNPDILRYILIIHDMRTTTSVDWEQTLKLQETVKKTYGVHVKVLPLWDHHDDTTVMMKTREELESDRDKHEDLKEDLKKLWPKSDEDRRKRRGGGGELIGLGYSSSTSNDVNEEAEEEEEEGVVSFSSRDLSNLSTFTREFVTQSIVPFLERQITVSYEQFQSSRKSLGGRLFSVGRKYFSSSSSTTTTNSSGTSGTNTRVGSPVPGGGGGGYDSVKGYYSFQSQESQSRRLGDLLFMLRDYKLAQTIYGEVAKDFKNDRAWKYYSNCLRIQGLAGLLSLFSSSNTSSYQLLLSNGSNSPDQLLQTSILSSASTTTGYVIDFDLLRSTMLYHFYYSLLPTPIATRLSSSCLMRLVELSLSESSSSSSKGGSTVGGSEDELWTAMICEQSALSQLGITNNNDDNKNLKRTTRTRSRSRKCVLEMYQSGIRYEKSGLKLLSRRCLSQASTLYSSSSDSDSDSSSSGTFSAIKTYLHHSLARQAYNASLPLEAIRHFLKLIPPPLHTDTTTTPTTPEEGGEVVVEGSQLDWLDDFSLAWELLLSSTTTNTTTSTRDRQSLAEELVKNAGIELKMKLFDPANIKVSRRRKGTTAAVGVTNTENEWKDLEKMVLSGIERSEASSGMNTTSKKRELKGKSKDNQALLGETFYLELPIRNPLEAFLSIGSLTVHTEEEENNDDDDDDDDDQHSPLEISQSLDGDVVELAPLESRIIYIPIKGSRAQIYRFKSLSYRFHNLLPVTESLSSSPSLRHTSTSITIDKHRQQQQDQLRFPTVELLRPIPILSISTSQLPTRLFQGQIEFSTKTKTKTKTTSSSSTTVLKIKNTGQVALKKLRGISSNPQIGFFDVDYDNKGNDENEAVLATTMTTENEKNKQEETIRIDNSLRRSDLTTLWTRDGETLEPGEEREVRVALRGDRVGEQDIKWLFVYESVSPSNDGELYSARAVHKLEVSPSLEFRYATRSSSGDQYPFVLDIEAYNSGIPAEDVCITSLSIFSPLWKVTSLLPADTIGEQEGEERRIFSTPIPWQQISNLALAIDRVEDGLKQCKESIAWSVGQVEGLLLGKKVDESKAGNVDLNFSTISSSNSRLSDSMSSHSTLLNSVINSHSHQRTLSLSSDFPTIPSHLLRSLFPLFSPSSSIVLIEFTSESLDLNGSHFLPLPSLGASRNYLREILTTAETKAGGLYAESQKERTNLIESLRKSELGFEMDPSEVFLQIEETVVREHEFSSGPCLIPVHFVIRNLSPTTSFEYTLTLGTTTDSALIYTGLLTRRNTIAPLSSSRISTKAFITREGLYDFGGWNLKVKTEEGKIWKKDGEKREVRVEGRRREKVPVSVAADMNSITRQSLVGVA